MDKYTGDDAPKPRTGKYPQDMKTLFETLKRVEKETGDAVKEQDLYEACKSHKWFRDYFDKLLLVLMREGTVYAPRPGFYRVT